jgi:non-ribosomal peptide synthetase component F
LSAYAYQDLPFEQVVDAVNPVRTTSHAPIYQVSFNLQNVPMGSMDLPGLSIEPVGSHSATAKLDMSMNLFEQGGALVGAIEYNTDLFDASTIARLFEHFEVLLRAVVLTPDTPVCDLPLVSAREAEQILAWSRGPDAHAAPALADASRMGLGAEGVALIFDGGQTLSYADLHTRANRLAHRLRAMGVQAETPVGICLDRSIDMVVSILAVLKSGGAYVPLDPAQPEDRLAYVVEDAQIPLVITTSALADRVPGICCSTSRPTRSRRSRPRRRTS